jgi:hypothetical protein
MTSTELAGSTALVTGATSGIGPASFVNGAVLDVDGGRHAT